MTHHIYRILIGLALILLVGAGCSDNDTNVVQNEQPTITPDQQAYATCVQAGYIPDLVTDDTGKRFYCILPDNTQCTVSKILDDSCFKEFEDREKEKERAINEKISIARVCDPIAKPVCGTDGRTYTNECIATHYQTEIAHDGACTPEEQKIAKTPDVPSTPNQDPTSPPNKTPNTEESLPDWIDIAYFLAKEQTNQPIETYACTINKKTYYLVKAVSCPTCLHTLYSENGTVACHTNHDVGKSCPRETVKEQPPTPCNLLSTR